MKVLCPHCAEKVELDSRLCGQQIGCPVCSGVFLMPIPTAKIVSENAASVRMASEGIDTVGEDSPKKSRVPTRACKQCKMEIPFDVTKCPHCKTRTPLLGCLGCLVLIIIFIMLCGVMSGAA